MLLYDFFYYYFKVEYTKLRVFKLYGEIAKTIKVPEDEFKFLQIKNWVDAHCTLRMKTNFIFCFFFSLFSFGDGLFG
jgi:hypothetical protein